MIEKCYKQLSDAIYHRKSTRDYSDTVVDVLENKGDLIDDFGLVAMVADIKVSVKVLARHEVRNKKAKYCIGFYSEEKPLALENIGFIGQQLDLILQSLGISTCWWGMKKPKKEFKQVEGLECFITMMAGMSAKQGEREYPKDFKRKSAADIVINNMMKMSASEISDVISYNGVASNNLIEAVRVAPSAVNRQPWLIENIGDKYNFYLRNSNNPLDMIIGDMRNIDLGIAVAHLFVQAKSDGKEVEFDFAGSNSGKHKFVVGARVYEK
ncbi:MAG: hypothetical protein FWC02_00770 [Firmicutes bacterium]|nr:hypothetical protein [Bacillota bacterium]